MNSIVDLKSLQDLQEKYQMKKKDIFDRLISDDINDKETVVKELDEIENEILETLIEKNFKIFKNFLRSKLKLLGTLLQKRSLMYSYRSSLVSNDMGEGFLANHSSIKELEFISFNILLCLLIKMEEISLKEICIKFILVNAITNWLGFLNIFYFILITIFHKER